MNIFVLDPNPVIAASMHCDQHLHKMILESAQMLSAAVCQYSPSYAPLVYKPAYIHHPCTRWVCESIDNMAWVVDLATALENTRLYLDCPSHASSEVIKVAASVVQNIGTPEAHTPFVFAGPGSIELRSSLSVPEKYKLYYQRKHKQWLDKGRGMTYKGRPVPEFMKEFL